MYMFELKQNIFYLKTELLIIIGIQIIIKVCFWKYFVLNSLSINELNKFEIVETWWKMEIRPQWELYIIHQ